jgi:hypothetical protein
MALVIFSQEPLTPSHSADLVRQVAGHYWNPLKPEYHGSPSSKPDHPLPFYLWEGTQLD